ncbi:MAG: hypothetical protein JW942_04190 [Opitutales bacterium]|nr:hypothetical protein [Opitutales bacterium]
MLSRGVRLFWQALKNNWIPAVGIWVAGALIVYAYYRGGFVRDAAEGILAMRERFGLWYPIGSMVLFGAVLPTLTQLLIMPGARRNALHRFPFIIPFWAWKGIEIEYFYKLQSIVYGDSSELGVIVSKVLTDQFIYTPTFGMISNVLYMRWIAVHIGELPRSTVVIPRGWFGTLVFPQLVACWALWIPAVSLVYMLPYPLQLPLANMILWLWSMMLIFMSRQDS